jgi:hypothetical protein
MEGRPIAMPSVSSQLSALCTKIQGHAVPGTDMTHRRVSMACICAAMHDLDNVATPLSKEEIPDRRTRCARRGPPRLGNHGEPPHDTQDLHHEDPLLGAFTNARTATRRRRWPCSTSSCCGRRASYGGMLSGAKVASVLVGVSYLSGTV